MKRVILVALALILLVSTVSGAAAQAPTTVSVGNYTIVPGQEIDVPITVTGARDWYGVDVRMAYDPAVVQVVNVKRGVIPQPDFVLWERFDSSKTYYVTTQLNPTLPASGDGVIVTVRLRGVAAGTAPLTLQAQIANRDGMEIPVVLQSGGVVVGAKSMVPTAIYLRGFTAQSGLQGDISFTESCVVGSVSGKVLRRITGTCPDTGHTFARRTLLKLKVGDAIEIIGCSVSKRGAILACPVTLYGGM